MHPETFAGGANTPLPSEAPIRHIAYDVVGSTNSEALARARAGDAGPLWITAVAQTAGRGRRGRAWTSEPGNLYATLLLRDPSPAALAPQLSFVGGLAVCDAILQFAGSTEARPVLKWPNDVFLRGAKVAGVLIEGEGTPLAVAIGVGVNCTSHPANTDYPATDLRAQGIAVEANDLLQALSRAMALRLAQWKRGTGFSAIRADWEARAHPVGSALRVRLAERELSGQFEALDDLGRLLLRLPDGSVETVTAGDVSVGRPAPAATTS
jgi:BirA family biotin operon repressor/biotin-[acetyl-CoA-carboxylase] ligase